MEYIINELAALAGVSTRTLRYYDQIGLLSPGRTTRAGYRVYGPAQVDRLQHILFYRALGLPLGQIRDLLDDPGFDRAATLRGHLAELEQERARLDSLILTLKTSIEDEKGGHTMSDQEKFECFKREALAENERAYGDEIRARYGGDAAAAGNDKFSKLTREEYARMEELGAEIRARLEAAVAAGLDPAGEEGRALAALHRDWLAFTWPSYSPQAHAGLAEGYVADPRFTAYYDRARAGCAAFLRDAILAYTEAL